MSNLMIRECNNQAISQRANDNYFNATQMCQSVDKRLNDYFSNKATIDFTKALANKTGIPAISKFGTNQALIVSRQGYGTWVHERVAVHLAMWADPNFAVQVTEWVTDWYKTKENPVNTPSDTEARLDRLEALLIRTIEKMTGALTALTSSQTEPQQPKPRKPRRDKRPEGRFICTAEAKEQGYLTVRDILVRHLGLTKEALPKNMIGLGVSVANAYFREYGVRPDRLQVSFNCLPAAYQKKDYDLVIGQYKRYQQAMW